MERRELLKDLASRIAAVELAHPVRVAVDGVDAAGKTMLANELAQFIDGLGRPVIRASIDGFHNPAAIRRRRGSASPEGYFEDSFNYDALLSALLQPLGPSGSRDFRRAVFDFRADQPVETPIEHAPPNAILLFDGVFLLRPRLREGTSIFPFSCAWISAFVFRIISENPNPEDEHWEFSPRSIVRCEWRDLSEGRSLVAVARATV
jgi:uridine kinase